MSTFDIGAAVLASLDPIVETDPTVLRSWADNLDAVAVAFDARLCPGLAEGKRTRAADLRRRAVRFEVTS